MCESYTGRLPPVAGFLSQAQLVFGCRVIQTAEGTGRLTEVPGNHQRAHRSAGGGTGQLGGKRNKSQAVPLKRFPDNLLTEETLCQHLWKQLNSPLLLGSEEAMA